MLFLGVRIASPSPAEAAADYARLLGVSAVPLADGAVRFVLSRGVIEIGPGEAGHGTLLFAGERPAVPSFHGLDVQLVADAVATPGPDDTAIDHIVVNAADATRALALWRDQVGLRLALDREFPGRGLRLLFFRSNGITLEYATPLPAPGGDAVPDRFYGVSYRVTDLAARRERLLAAGLDVSEIRQGMKPGTVVATVRSGTAGVPTLLIQPAAARV